MDSSLEQLIRRPVGVDAMRVLAVGIVGWFHIWQQSWVGAGKLTVLPRTGYVWVDMMILLSAFCLALPYGADQALNQPFRGTKGFYARRAIRILPAFYLCAGVHLIVYLSQGHWTDDLWVDIFSHLTLTHTYFYHGYLFTHLGAALWTVGVLAGFYALFPVLIRGFAAKPVLTVLLMLAGQWGYTAVVLPLEGAAYQMRFNQLPAFLGVFALGMMAAFLYPRLVLVIKGRGKLLFAMGAAAVFMAIFDRLDAWMVRGPELQHMQLYYRMPLAVLFTALLLCFCLAMGRSDPKNPLVLLSGISYSFYLWHQSLAVWLKSWRVIPWQGEVPPNQLGDTVWMQKYNILCWAAALAVAVISTYLVEKPAADRLKKLINRAESAKKDKKAGKTAVKMP